jgi:hypothetical protein
MMNPTSCGAHLDAKKFALSRGDKEIATSEFLDSAISPFLGNVQVVVRQKRFNTDFCEYAFGLRSLVAILM